MLPTQSRSKIKSSVILIFTLLGIIFLKFSNLTELKINEPIYTNVRLFLFASLSLLILFFTVLKKNTLLQKNKFLLAFQAALGILIVLNWFFLDHSLTAGRLPILLILSFAVPALASIIKNESTQKIFCIISIIPALFVSVSGIKNVLSNSDITTDRNNIADFFGNINMAAEYVLFSIMILLYLLVKNSPIRRELVLYYTSLLILSSYIILTASRSAIVALLSMFILFAYLSKKKIVFFLALALIGINLSFLSNPKKNVIASNIATRKNSANYRLTMWKNAIQLIKKYPMGIGGDNYQFKYLPYRSRISPKEIDRSPHNEFLAFTAEHGLHSFLITILFGLFLLSHILSRIGRTDRNITYCFIVALGIQSFFQFPLENGLTIILILFLFICIG